VIAKLKLKRAVRQLQGIKEKRERELASILYNSDCVRKFRIVEN
jgi:uncharacterized protein YbaR (Trm112 family)